MVLRAIQDNNRRSWVPHTPASGRTMSGLILEHGTPLVDKAQGEGNGRTTSRCILPYLVGFEALNGVVGMVGSDLSFASMLSNSRSHFFYDLQTHDIFLWCLLIYLLFFVACVLLFYHDHMSIVAVLRISDCGLSCQRLSFFASCLP